MYCSCPNCGKEFNLLKATLKEKRVRTLSPAQIIDLSLSFFELTQEEIMIRNRKHEYVKARYVIYYLLKKYTSLGVTRIGQMFQRDHTTVIHGLNELKDMMITDKDIRLKVALLCEQIEELCELKIAS